MKRDRRSGFTYVAVLVLLVILMTIGLTFVSRSGILASATLGRRERLQAEYLAESALNHAVWAIQNDANSIENDTTYYMYSLGRGRYGYKVRVSTPTTFATVATVGVFGDQVARQSYVLNLGAPGFFERLFTAYWSEYQVIGGYAYAGFPGPKWREWSDSTWSDEATAFDDAVEGKWVKLEGSPRSNEMVMGVQKSDGTIEVAVFDGAAWGNRMTLTASSSQKCFDLAYEELSGEAVLLAGTDGGNVVRYSKWNGASWSPNPPDTAFVLASSNIQVVEMASNPTSDEMFAGVLTSNLELTAAVWNGATFTAFNPPMTNLPLAVTGAFDIVYESQSGEALLVYGSSLGTKAKYRTWNGSSLSGILAVWEFGAVARLFRLAADPTSDYIALAASDASSDLHLVAWDGAAWIDHKEVETSLPSSTLPCFDVAWRSSGEKALFAWGRQAYGTVFFIDWPKGTSFTWLSPQMSPALCMNMRLLRLEPIAQSDSTVCLVVDNQKTLVSAIHDDGGFGSGSAIALLKAEGYYMFDMAVTRP